MKKILSITLGVILLFLLIFFTVSLMSVFLKAPMVLSGYSSLFMSHFNSRFLLLAIILFFISILFIWKGNYYKKLWKLNALLSGLFLIGQIVFMLVIYKAANKYGVDTDFLQTFKSYEKGLKSSETYAYTTMYGEEQLLDVFHPEKHLSNPSIPVILVHGGAFIEGNRTQWGYAPEWFLEKGFTVFSIDYPLAKENRQTWETAVNSVLTSVSYILKNSKKLKVDSTQYILVGGSAGAALVMQADLGLRTGFAKSYLDDNLKPPTAVIAVYPPVDLVDLWHKVDEGKNLDVKHAAIKYIGGSPEKFPERYEQLNLIKKLSKGISPTLIVTGEVDHVVNVEATRKFVEKTKALKLPVSYVEVPYGEHVFDANSNSLSGQIEWFKIGEFLQKNHLYSP